MELTIDAERYLHIQAAARIVELATSGLSRLCREGVVRGFKIGGVWHVQEASLNAFLRDRVERKEEIRRNLAELRRNEQRLARHPSTSVI